jgi:NCS1 family nucleobase:cation symporter-1
VAAAPDEGAVIAAVDAAMAESLPLVRSERTWSFLDVLSVKSGLAIATWAFLFGGTTAQFTGFVDGVVATFFGLTIGIVLLLLAIVLPSYRWGTEFFVHQRSVYGAGGVVLFVLVAVLVAVFMWASILATMIGRAAVEITRTVSTTPVAEAGGVTTVVALVMLVVAWTILVRGSRGVRALNRVAAPALLVLALWLLVAILQKVSIEGLLAAPPIAPVPDRAMNIMLVVELHIAAGLSWYALAGNLARYARTPRSAVWGSWVAYVLVGTLSEVVGLASALTLSSADPVAWMVPMVGPVAGVVLLVLLAVANLSSLVGMVQGNAQTLVQHLGAGLQRLGWRRFTAVMLSGVALLVVLAPAALYDRFYTLVAYLQAIFAPAAGVAFADRVLLRRGHVDVRALYATGGTSPYRYWAGINPVAFVALGAGAVTFLALFDPLAYTGTPVFLHLSATVPAFAVGALLHTLLTRWVVMPSGQGGYPARARG